MKKILLTIILLFIPLGGNALEPNYKVESLNIEANVQGNGSLLVKEAITLRGAFNGYIRDLSYKGDYPLYDASAIKLRKVCESKDLIPNTCFLETLYATNGDSYVYQRSEYSDYISLKMFNYNPTGAKTFYIEYVLEDVVVIHNDIAELYWTFVGENFDDDIDDVKITIKLPNNSNELRAWVHGPLSGNVALEDDNRVVATIQNLYANNLIDIRAVFDKELVPLGTKLSNKTELKNIVDKETELADEANRQRSRAQIIMFIVSAINILWIIGAIVLVIHVYLKYDKERKSNFKLEYYREFPGEYGPEVMEYLISKSVSTKGLSASILNIIRKKGFKVREEPKKRGKKEYVLENVDQGFTEPLTEEEEYIKGWLIDECGDGKEVSMKDIKDASKTETSARKFIKKYNSWKSKTLLKSQKEEFYDDNIGIKIKMGLYAAIAIVLLIVNGSVGIGLLTVAVIFVGIILIIYTVTFQRRTIKGNDHYVKWMALKKFLLDFGRFDEKELPEIVLWEKYLVYAAAFGIADKVSKAMEVKVKNMNVDTTNRSAFPMYSYLYFNHAFTSSLVSTVNTARSLSTSKIAQSQASSGGGFGGGFSGGGGFGGGGTGGGGRGF